MCNLKVKHYQRGITIEVPLTHFGAFSNHLQSNEEKDPRKRKTSSMEREESSRKRTQKGKKETEKIGRKTSKI